MRVLIDYRPALRERSGVGEYTHELARALQRRVALTLFSSSWKDRLAPDAELDRAETIDRHVPVRALNFMWHRLGWPPAETLTRRTFDVTHSLHPLRLPSRRAAQVITIHDLNFLTHPERTVSEIRRDYPALALRHARLADRIVTVSEFTAGEVVRQFGVSRDRISVCSPGAPDWAPRTGRPSSADEYILFFGTLEPRKNVGGLLDAYERLVARRPDAPALILAGKAAAGSAAWLDRIARTPLRGKVRHVGYVAPSDRRALYDAARMLVQPSFEEGFGIPVLEAMTLGIPVVASDRGALPEVLSGAGLVVNPEDPDEMASAIERVLDDGELAAACASKGVERARHYDWSRTADEMVKAYQKAIDAHRG